MISGLAKQPSSAYTGGMYSVEQSRYEARAKIIKALASPARLRLVDGLRDGPRCVCDLRTLVGSDLSTVSKHLAVLRNAGIVADARRGVQVFYRLRCPCVVDFFACAEKVLQATACEQIRVLGGARGRAAARLPKRACRARPAPARGRSGEVRSWR